MAAALDGNLAATRRAAPTMSAGLLGSTGARWRRTLEKQLEEEQNQGTGGIVASPAAADVDQVDGATLEALAAAVEPTNKTAAGELRAWIGVPEQIAVAMAFWLRPAGLLVG